MDDVKREEAKKWLSLFGRVLELLPGAVEAVLPQLPESLLAMVFMAMRPSSSRDAVFQVLHDRIKDEVLEKAKAALMGDELKKNDAPDVAQVALVNLWLALVEQQYNPTCGDLGGYLGQIIKRAAINQAVRRRGVETRLPDGIEPAATDRPVEEQWIVRDELEIVLGKLNPVEREVMRRFSEGETAATIAQAMGLHHNKVPYQIRNEIMGRLENEVSK